MREIEVLKNTIYNTVDELKAWYEVLRGFSELTGAPKGIITLRDRLTAELVIPSDVRHDLSSPMLYGFSEQEVENYISHYVQFDPWTEFENLYHPVSPYPLSKYVSFETLKLSPFWEWLEPQGIGDTVVIDIGTFSKNWIAMNLYFPSGNEVIKQDVLRYTTALQADMQRAWSLGQRYRAAQHSSTYLKYFVDQQPNATFLIEPDGTLIASNNKGSKLLNNDIGFYIDAQKYFLIRDNRIREQFKREVEQIKKRYASGSQAEPIEIVLSGGGFSITIALIAGIEDKIGADHSLRLITVQNQNNQQSVVSDQPIWNHQTLTPRERQLVQLLANGGRVVDFTNKYKIKKTTGHFHWGNVKKKLKVKDRGEIYAHHQLFKQNL